MYLSHFGFSESPFKNPLFHKGKQRCYISYFSGVELMLAHACNEPGSVGLYGDDESVIESLVVRLRQKSVMASCLLVLNNGVSIRSFDKKIADDIHYATGYSNGARRLLLVIQIADSFTPLHKRILRKHIEKAEAQGVEITLLLAGRKMLAEELKKMPDMWAVITTNITIRSPTFQEVRQWFSYQFQWNGLNKTLFSTWQIFKIYSRCQGRLSQISQVAHYTLLAAFTERSRTVKSRHLRSALNELTGPPRHVAVSALASMMWLGLCIALGWQALPHTSSLLPLPAKWAQKPSPSPTKPVDKIEDSLDQPIAAMRQLFRVWGYDVPLEEAFCEEAGRAKLQCKRGESPISTLEKNGYPWLAELRVGDRVGYASVVRSSQNDMDLLMGNKTWQVSRNWFKHVATGNYVLLYRLTPQGNSKVDAKSDASEIVWLNKMLSRALMKPKNNTAGWSGALVDNIKEFQHKAGIKADGQLGEGTLMKLLIASGESPGLIRDKEASDMYQKINSQKVNNQQAPSPDATTELAAVSMGK